MEGKKMNERSNNMMAMVQKMIAETKAIAIRLASVTDDANLAGTVMGATLNIGTHAPPDPVRR